MSVYFQRKGKNGSGHRTRSFSIGLCHKIVRSIRQKDGRFWERLRVRCYRRLLAKIGVDIKLRCGVIIKEPEGIRLNNRISIQENCYLSGYGGLTIGDDVSIGTGVYIFTSTHPMEGIIRNNPLQAQPVSIGNNVWIGAGARILGGVTIGNNVVIGAAAVVTHDLPDGAVYAGVPAKKVRDLIQDGHEE